MFCDLRQAALSYDKTIVTSLVFAATDESFASAQLVYENGGNSKSMAKLNIKNGLPVPISRHTKLTAQGSDGRDVTGFADADYAVGDPVILFRYPVADYLQNPSDCRVGDLPENKRLQMDVRD